MKHEKALEVACGEAHVTRHVLRHIFHEIDLFDHCPQSVMDATNNLKGEPKVGTIRLFTM